MNQINQDTRRLASLAVFSELYDSQKDIYTIISYFLDDIIETFSKHTFYSGPHISDNSLSCAQP